MVRPLRVVEGLELPKLRCAPFHSALEVDPVGSAGAYDAFLCVEVPLPWPRDISASEPFLTLCGAGVASFPDARGRTVRPQGLVPRPGAEGWTRVLFYEQRAPASDAGPYLRREWWVGADEVLELCRALVDDDHDVVGRFEERRVEVPEHVVDVLVCTHGKRDACCGGSGAVLHDQVEAALQVEAGSEHVRLWRTSHTGGHRFAPTALTFPDGYGWAHLDVRRTVDLAGRTATPAELARHCRGAASLSGPAAQAADWAALCEVGWGWAEARRTALVTGFDRATLATDVHVEGRWPDGSSRAFHVAVELDRHVPQITCGLVDGPEYEVEPTWRIGTVVETTAR